MDRVHAVVGSCEQLPFPNQWFDIVVGVGIWHHLQDNLQTPCSEVARVLVPNGFGVFSEPIAQSNALNRIRNRVPVAVPASVSPRCQPLSTESFDFLRSYFRVDAEFFELFGRVTRLILHGAPLENAPPAKRLAIFLLHQLDRVLFSLPNTERLAGAVVLKLSSKEATVGAKPAS